MEEKKQKSLYGIFLVLIKILGKIGPILAKTIKSAFVLKVVGAAASMGLYTYLWSWQMAIGLIVFLLIHEYGHMWAMKKSGMKTNGMYLIPGIGAVAISKEEFSDAKKESFIALMGPVFGLFFIIPMIGIYFISKNNLFLSIASVMAIINLFNLFPINPLDGGRIFKSIAFSVNHVVGIITCLMSLVVGIMGGFIFNMLLISLISLIGFFEFITMLKIGRFVKRLGTLTWTIIFSAAIIYIFPMIIYQNLLFRIASALMIIMVSLLLVFNIKSYKKSGWSVGQLINEIKELPHNIWLSRNEIKESYTPMDKKTTIINATLYLTTIVVMAGIILFASSITGFETVSEVFK